MGILIKNCNLINICNGDTIPNSTILLNGRRIIEINPKLNNIKKSEIIDANGGWVLPGLSDVHVHICHEGAPELAKSFSFLEPEIHSFLRAAKNLHLSLESGITSVRDVGTYKARNLEIKKAIEKGIFIGPRIIACGHLITSPEGHVHEIGKEVKGIAEARKTVKDEIRNGADFIKVANDPIGLSFDELQAIVDESHKFGKKVACHAFTKESIELALNAKVDTIEHAAPFNSDIAKQMVEQDTIIVPTYYCAIETCKDIQKSFITKEELPIFNEWLKSLESNIPRAMKYGVKVSTGTDAGYPPLIFNDVINEIESLAKISNSPLKALQASTTIAAEVMDLENYIGSIEKGKLADIIIMEENPLKNISVLKDIKIIIKDGMIIKNCYETQTI